VPMTVPPDTPETLIRNILQQLVLRLELQPRPAFSLPREWAVRWVEQLHEVLALLAENDRL
jgi:hypothetical protein